MNETIRTSHDRNLSNLFAVVTQCGHVEIVKEKSGKGRAWFSNHADEQSIITDKRVNCPLRPDCQTCQYCTYTETPPPPKYADILPNGKEYSCQARVFVDGSIIPAGWIKPTQKGELPNAQTEEASQNPGGPA